MEKNPGCLGCIGGLYYPVIWGLEYAIVRIPINQGVFSWLNLLPFSKRMLKLLRPGKTTTTGSRRTQIGIGGGHAAAKFAV